MIFLSASGLLKSLGTHTARIPHYHVLGPSLICLSPQISLATKYLASCKYSIEYHFHTVSLEEHQQSSTHNSRDHIAASYLSSSLDSSLEFKILPKMMATSSLSCQHAFSHVYYDGNHPFGYESGIPIFA
jgi:hypothetical protein